MDFVLCFAFPYLALPKLLYFIIIVVWFRKNEFVLKRLDDFPLT